MIAGPIIKYRDFVKLSSEERLDFSLVNVANGYMLFARGFVKRIGISAIMADAYDSICEAVAAEGDLKLGVGAFLVLLMLTNVYFAFSGYSDMGRGLALIMGMKIESDFYYPFAACTPTDYLRRFFRSLGDFLEDYVALPIERVACRGSDGRITWRKRTVSFFAGAVVATITALWFKASIPMLVAFLPLILLIAAERAVHCGSSLVRRNLATRTVGRIVTLVLVSLFWTQLKLRSVGQLLDYFGTLTVLGSYQSYMVYMTVFNQEYIWALLAAAWLVIPAVLGW